MRKFQRQYRLTVEPATRSSILNGALKLLPGNDARIVITNPITIEFSVQRSPQQTTNSSTFRLYNLSQDTRVALYKDIYSFYHLRQVTLEAGYEEPLPVIFKGGIQECSSWRQEGSVDVITEMRCWDGGFGIANAFSSWTENGPVERNTIIGHLVTDLGNYGLEPGVRSDFPAVYWKGRTVAGSTWDALQVESGGAAFIDKSKVHVLKSHQAFAGSLPEISSATGLLGTPKRSGNGVTCEMVFEPRLEVGQHVILITSEKLFADRSGEAKVMGLAHNGTISDAVSGKCKTVAQLFFGFSKLSILETTPESLTSVGVPLG